MSTSDERVLRLLQEARGKLEADRARRTEPIAIVGMGCRFPGGASSPAAFWRLLEGGVDATRAVPADRWDAEALYDPDPAAPGKSYVKRGGFLEAIDGFEPEFFGISPREAVAMDPQQRLLLEVAWEALEDAGIVPDRLRGSPTGVWVGLSLDDYAGRSLGSGDLRLIDAYSALGNARSLAAGRIAYVLDLHGPVMQLDASCASSLVAVHLACQSLRMGECDLALVGGVNVISSPEATIALCKLRALAPDGRCKTFDAGADGYGRGEGCGVVVLKRLADAKAATDRVHAVIRGTAINHDGRSNGLTAPNGAAQESVIRAALANAGVDPLAVGYVEAHGTGTLLGDPIEVLALNRVYGAGRARETPLHLGSVKTNFGHLEGAAGIAGLMKAALCLSHQRVVAHLHFEDPNPRIPWNRMALQVTTAAIDWPDAPGGRVAGVSAFGLSGTNAHALLEEARGVPPTGGAPTRRAELIVLSAKTDEALASAAGRLREHVQTHRDVTLGDLAFSLATTRSALERRLAIVVPTQDSLCAALEGFASGHATEVRATGQGRALRGKLAWLFGGQGAQQLGMGKALSADWPAFRRAFDTALEAIDRHLDRPLRPIMWAEPGAPDAYRLEQTAYTQPALFAFGWGLAALWRSWGVEPDLVAGHSIGELTAACVAGLFSLEDAARLVCARGRLMQSLPVGAMVAVGAPEAEVARAIEPYAAAVTIAAVNAPSSVVISGEEARVMEVAEALRARGRSVKRLSVSHAFHSAYMDPMLDTFLAAAASVTFRPATVVVVSNLTGTIADGEMASARHWARHVREPVRFSAGVQALEAAGAASFIEMGPRPTLLPMIAASLSRRDAILLASGGAGNADGEAALTALATWVAEGGHVDWDGVCVEGGRRVRLPTYPWQRRRYWIERSVRPTGGQGTEPEHRLLGRLVPSASADTRYESVVSLGRWPWLGDHRIDGHVVLPAAALVALIQAAADDHRGDAAAAIDEMTIKAPLRIPDGSVRRVQVSVTDGGASVAVYAQPTSGGTAWTLHAVARLSASSEAEPSRVALSDVRGGCAGSLDVATAYERLSARGLGCGPSFRALKALSNGAGQAIADIDLGVAIDMTGHVLHPALLETAIVALAHALHPGADSLFQPAELKGVHVHQSGATCATAHAHLTKSPTVDSVCFNLTLYDPTGAPIVRVREVTCRPADRGPVREDDLAANIRSLYRIEWRSTEVGALERGLSGRWIVAGSGDRAESLAAELSAMGARSETLPIASLRELGPAEHVVCVWEGKANDAHGAIDMATEGLAVVQALAGAAEPPRLWWVTQEAMAVKRGDDVAPWASTLWGLGRTVMQEHPGLRCTLVDLSTGAGVAAYLAREIAAADDEYQVAWRSDRRYVPRLVRASREHTPAGPVPLRTDGTVLITGGLGALGLEAARSLARSGVKHLVLIGRRGLDTPGATAAVTELEGLGASVTVAAVDVTDREALARLFASVPRERPLRAILHTAAQIDDGVLSEQTSVRFAMAMAAKVVGAYNLHILSASLLLDRFVLFSSLAGTLGSAGQGAYAAANVFVDALAALRQAHGLPGSSIAWGPWESGGLTGKLDSTQRGRLAQQGVRMISATEGARLIGEGLGRPEAEIIMAVLDLPAVEGSGRAVAPLWHELVRRSVCRGGTHGGAGLDQLPIGEQLDALTQIVRAEAAKVLSSARPTAVPVDVPLRDLGVDSLMALEMRNGIAHRTGMSFPGAVPFHQASCEAIAKQLILTKRAPQRADALGTLTAVARCEPLNQVTAPWARLFCFHDAGGSSAIFAPFVGLPGVETHAISHTRAREPSAETAAEYLREAVAYIRSASDLPFALFGHSLGSVFALRIAEELESEPEGPLPVLLIASGSLPPDELAASLSGNVVSTAFRHIFGTAGNDTPHLRRDVEADISLWRSMPSPLRRRVNIPIAAFRGTGDHVVSENGMRFWARYTTKEFSLTALPGTHHYLTEEASCRLLLEAVGLRLRPASTADR